MNCKPIPKKPKKKLPTLKSLRTKTDGLLTPLIKQLFPKCLLCGKDTQVAHHHVHKAASNRLRYEISNLINLCKGCHFKLHQNESYWASRIVEIKGLEWFQKLEKIGTEYVKVDRFWYASNYERLSRLLND